MDIYKATYVERVLVPVSGGLSMAMTSIEFGEMFGKTPYFLQQLTSHTGKALVLDKYYAEQLGIKEQGRYMYWVDEVEERFKPVIGMRSAKGTLEELAKQLHESPSKIKRYYELGWLVGKHYLIQKIGEKNDEEGTD